MRLKATLTQPKTTFTGLAVALRERFQWYKIPCLENVYFSAYIYWFGHINEEQLSFEVQLQVRHRWIDEVCIYLLIFYFLNLYCRSFLYLFLLQRLSFSNANVTTDLLLSSIEGEEWFYERIWTPNIFIENELSSQIMDLTRQNFYVSISRLGLVQVSYRYFPNLFDNLPIHLVNFMSLS